MMTALQGAIPRSFPYLDVLSPAGQMAFLKMLLWAAGAGLRTQVIHLEIGASCRSQSPFRPGSHWFLKEELQLLPALPC